MAGKRRQYNSPNRQRLFRHYLVYASLPSLCSALSPLAHSHFLACITFDSSPRSDVLKKCLGRLVAGRFGQRLISIFSLNNLFSQLLFLFLSPPPRFLLILSFPPSFCCSVQQLDPHSYCAVLVCSDVAICTVVPYHLRQRFIPYKVNNKVDWPRFSTECQTCLLLVAEVALSAWLCHVPSCLCARIMSE